MLARENWPEGTSIAPEGIAINLYIIDEKWLWWSGHTCVYLAGGDGLVVGKMKKNLHKLGLVKKRKKKSHLPHQSAVMRKDEPTSLPSISTAATWKNILTSIGNLSHVMSLDVTW